MYSDRYGVDTHVQYTYSTYSKYVNYLPNVQSDLKEKIKNNLFYDSCKGWLLFSWIKSIRVKNFLIRILLTQVKKIIIIMIYQKDKFGKLSKLI